MSAMNLIQQSEAVHLISDGGLYERDGTLIGEIVKTTFMSEKDRWALGFRGRMPNNTPPELWQISSFDDVLAAMPRVVRRMHETLRNQDVNETFDKFLNFECIIIGWSADRDQPEAWGIATSGENDDTFANIPDFAPFTVFPLPLVIAAPGIPIMPIIGDIYSMADLDALDVDRVGVEILEAQRRTRFPFGDRDVHCVGCFGEITTVSRTGVSRRRLIEWDDEIGKPIDPAVQGKI